MLKVAPLLVFAVAALAEPQAPSRNAYLPPDPNGYKYTRPGTPFAEGPSTPRPPTPTYSPPPTPFRPTFPSRPTPPPFPPTPSYGPPPYSPSVPTQTIPVRPPIHVPSTRPPRPPTDGEIQLPQNGHHDHGHDHVHEPGMPFDFAYSVKADEFGNDYSHNAVSNGDVVNGEYRVQLPDGRMQIVRYTADWATGYHADVSYEGQAQLAGPGGNYAPPRRPGY